jgi:hypothetical protein
MSRYYPFRAVEGTGRSSLAEKQSEAMAISNYT